MATPKIVCSEVEGFVHNVSPVLQSRSSDVKYFSAVVQEATRNSRLIVFNVQRHNQFQCVEKDKSPVKLSGVCLNKSRQEKDKLDITFNTVIKLSVIKKLSFAFDEVVDQDVDQEKTGKVTV